LIGFHQINAPSSCYISFEKLCCKKGTWGKRELTKMDTKMSKILKTMGTKMLAIKKERKEEIAPTLAKCLKLQQERYVSKCIVELG
jgi:hypothetical protein